MQQLFSQSIRFSRFDDEGKEKKLGEVLDEKNEKATESKQFEVLSSTTKELCLQSEYFNREIASSDST